MSEKYVYCAGGFDFTQHDWKSKIAQDYRVKFFLKGDTNLFMRPSHIKIKENVCYAGPWYFEDSTDTTGFVAPEEVVSKEMGFIDSSTDCVFVLNRNDILGTIAELVYAIHHGKTLHIVYLNQGEFSETESEYHNPCWYAITMATILSKDVHLYEYKTESELNNHLKNIYESL